MHPQMTSVRSNPAPDDGKELFLLSDEQILDIAPETQDVDRDPRPASLGEPGDAHSRVPSTEERAQSTDSGPRGKEHDSSSTDHGSRSTGHGAQVTGRDSPPAWLAARMKDPWGGEEAREFWDGVQQAKSEAAAYRAAFATPEDARAL